VGYEVDVAKLRDVAGKVDGSAGAVGQLFRSGHGGLALPAAGAAGWVTTGAVGPAALAWEAFGVRLQSMVAGLAADLRSSADEFAAVDRSAAHRFGGSSADLYGGRRFE
jgi:uncharacterized protein YukE